MPYLSFMNKPVIRWGIMGCGRIARKFASDLQWVKNARLIAVGSRNAGKARQFAKEFSAIHAHGSYEELVQNSEVDVIYIATPHSCHYENALLCIRYKKAVLCEKPFAINTRQAKKMIRAGRQKKVFVMEAVWTRFLPHYIEMQKLIRQGKIGTVRNVLVNFGFTINAQAPSRLLDPAMGGGTLLDIGIYNVFMAISILGKPDRIQAAITATGKGIDEQCAIQFMYKNGSMAQLFSSFVTNLPTEVVIGGTKGFLKLSSRFYEPSSQVELRHTIFDKEKIIPVKKYKGIGYHHEASHVTECLQKGLTESPVMKHEDTLLIMSILDKIRKIAGISYKADEDGMKR